MPLSLLPAKVTYAQTGMAKRTDSIFIVNHPWMLLITPLRATITAISMKLA